LKPEISLYIVWKIVGFTSDGCSYVLKCIMLFVANNKAA